MNTDTDIWWKKALLEQILALLYSQWLMSLLHDFAAHVRWKVYFLVLVLTSKGFFSSWSQIVGWISTNSFNAKNRPPTPHHFSRLVTTQQGDSGSFSIPVRKVSECVSECVWVDESGLGILLMKNKEEKISKWLNPLRSFSRATQLILQIHVAIHHVLVYKNA